MFKIETKEDLECVNSTTEHKILVKDLLYNFAEVIKQRADSHDQSKLEVPEFGLFSELTPRLAQTTYGSEEYKKTLDQLKIALDHHYANNRHHPEHFKNGINDMTLIDLLEMVIDWYCASKRHNDGNIYKSLEINTTRFNISEQLVRVFKNTIELILN
jgi:hypothetical protein